MQTLAIAACWYKEGWREDGTDSTDMYLHWVTDTKESNTKESNGHRNLKEKASLIPITTEVLESHAIELTGVSAIGKGNMKLMVAFCLQYADFLNAKRKVPLSGGYTYIIAMLGKTTGKTNHMYEEMLASFGFRKAQ